jgi:hypothetical protein
MPDPFDADYNRVINAITKGQVIPFLGAGVNLCDRTPEIEWEHGQCNYLPNGGELAAYLSENFDYPSSETQVSCPSCDSKVPLKTQDLMRVSQYVAVMNGTGPLYDTLHFLFDVDYRLTPLHQFFAILPATLRAKGYPHPYQLIVTTNYDDLLERAFEEANEPFDLVCYVAEGKQRGKFLHRPPGGEARLIEKANEYYDLPLEMHGNRAIAKRTVILKIHGAVDRTAPDAEQDSYVVTEDHYIDYLTRTDISILLPATLAAKLRSGHHFLFLGYGLRDWNLRVILHRIWGDQKLSYKSWAIQLNPDELDREFWMKRNVVVFDVHLKEYIAALSERVQALPHARGAS